MQLLHFTTLTNTFTCVIQELPFLRSSLEYLGLCKGLRGRHPEINYILQQLLELSFCPKLKNVQSMRLTTSTYLVFAFVIWSSSLLHHWPTTAPRNGETLPVDWKSDDSHRPSNPFSGHKSTSSLAFWEVYAKAQSNRFRFSVLNKRIQHCKDCPFWHKRTRNLFAINNAQDALIESGIIWMVDSLILRLMPRDNACLASYLNIAYKSTQGIIPTGANFESTGGRDSIGSALYCCATVHFHHKAS